ncbi:hypothetical protein Sste5346_000798 [Sporothrix stenoceras]|uniref:Uncharacterized protein n=1 Tax=Sporothrix stenoceras TaxID=5173 RepID=A0ABR3ZRK4_9PEZI
MCLEGKVPQPSVSMQQPTEELDVPKHSSYYKWDPSASPFPVQHMSLSQFRETNLSAEERQVARPGEIRRAMFGEMADMRGLWTDIIFNNFQREPVEVSDPFAEENKKLAEENTAKPTKTIVYDGPLNTKSAFDVSDDEGEEDEEDEEEESVEEVAKVAERLVGMVAQIEKVVEIKMVDVKRGDVKEIDIKKVDTGANIQIKPMPMTKFGKKRTAQTALPRQAKRKSQWTELQGRLQEASNKMKQLMRCNGSDFLEQSNEPSVPKVPVVPSAHTVCRPPPLKVVGRTPPRRPNWAHQNIFDEAGLEQFLDCSCAASVEKCPGCKPSAVRVAVEEDLI